MSAAPIPPVAATPLPDVSPVSQNPLPPAAGPTSFGQLLTDGIDKINTKILDADKTVRAFALDDTVPVHQVTFALDEARSAMELALQIRSRLLDGYQQLMNMQL
jgi:flagellar hook-basal body complex protein FliE